jgi:uncharacterized membrane protein
MNINDPIQKFEQVVKGAHDGAGKYTKPVLQRYPLLFSFLIVFSAAAFMHGFEMWAEQIGLFKEKPIYLMLIGLILLFLTGTLYKSLKKMK